eukprot:SAG25_NODE_1957_length_2100_cov_1.393803_3_plen_29_part_01
MQIETGVSTAVCKWTNTIDWRPNLVDFVD